MRAAGAVCVLCVMGRRGIGRKQLLDELKEKRRYGKLKEDAQFCESHGKARKRT